MNKKFIRLLKEAQHIPKEFDLKKDVSIDGIQFAKGATVYSNNKGLFVKDYKLKPINVKYTENVIKYNDMYGFEIKLTDKNVKTLLDAM
jgi:hypothetical protein